MRSPRLRCLVLTCLAVLGGGLAAAPARGQGFSTITSTVQVPLHWLHIDADGQRVKDQAAVVVSGSSLVTGSCVPERDGVGPGGWLVGQAACGSMPKAYDDRGAVHVAEALVIVGVRHAAATRSRAHGAGAWFHRACAAGRLPCCDPD